MFIAPNKIIIIMIELSRANAFSHQTMNTLEGDHISSRVFVIYIYI